MADTHISQQFGAELDALSNKVMSMGGLVEIHVQDACAALVNADRTLAEKVLAEGYKVNALEVAIDEQCTQIIARRQPTASDLRLIFTIMKTVTDLERIGDEAEKISRMAIEILEMEHSHFEYEEIRHLGEHVRKMLHNALDAYARFDVELAIQMVEEDSKIDREYESAMRQLITVMIEDPREIRRILSTLWAARALERIGDHAKNICEYVIYRVKGHDVRHITLEQIRKEV